MPDESMLAGDAGPLGIYSDSAKRLSDSYNVHILSTANHGRWIAVRIQDGYLFDVKTHEHVFETRDESVSALGQFHSLYVPMRLLPTGISPMAASAFLNYNRYLYSNGMRMPSPTVMPTIPGRKWEMQ